MKKNQLLLNVGAALLLAPLTSITIAQAQSWQTVDTTPGIDLRGVLAGTDSDVFSTGLDVTSDGQLAGTSSIRRSDDHGITWATVASLPGSLTRLAKDNLGQLYAAGGLNNEAVMYRSSDLGATWTQIFTTASTYAGGAVRPTAPAIDNSGNIFVALRSSELVQISRKTTDILDVWLVYKGVPDASAPGGLVWSQVDRYRLAPTGVSLPYAVVVRPSPNPGWPDEIFVGGGANSVTSGSYWIVRKSVDGGTTWSTVNSYQLSTKSGGNWMRAMTVDPAGVLYAAGEVTKALSKTTSEPGWLVRKSTDGGLTWSNLDYLTWGRGPSVAVDAFGRVFVAGYQVVTTPSGSSGQWLVRGSGGNGSAWQTIDQLPTGSHAFDLIGDAHGNVFVCGTTFGPVGQVRKLAAP